MNGTAALLAQLVAIDSINPNLVPGGAGESDIAHFVANWLGEAGVEVMLHEPLPRHVSVTGTVHGTDGGRSLLLNAHLDTVGVAGITHICSPH